MLDKISTDPRILSLARSILQNTETVTKYLQDNDLAEPTWELEGSTTAPTPVDDPKLESARQAVIEATEELKLLMLGPTDYISSIRSNELLGIQMVSRFNVPTLFPVGKEVSFEQIASKIGLPLPVTRRFLRTAILKGIFCEPQDGYLGHNAVSKALAENDKLLDSVGFITNESWPAAALTLDALQKWPGSEKSTETGFCLAHHIEHSMYEDIKRNPERARRFDNTMAHYGDLGESRMDYMTQGYAWDCAGEDALVVDLGGGFGPTCHALAKVYPKLRFIVQDLPHVVANAPITDERVQMMGHNLLEPQPVHGADIYFLRRVLHNWDDASSVQMLKNLVPAMKAGTRIVVVDEVLPPPGVMSPSIEEKMRNMDLCMLALYNSKVRDMEEWQAIYNEADPRFQMKSSTTPPDSLLTFMELVWTP